VAALARKKLRPKQMVMREKMLQASVDVHAEVVDVNQTASPDVVDATAQLLSASADGVREARLQPSVRMAKAKGVDEAFMCETVDRLHRRCSTAGVSSARHAQSIERSERLVQIAQQDDLLHAEGPAEQLTVEIVRPLNCWV